MKIAAKCRPKSDVRSSSQMRGKASRRPKNVVPSSSELRGKPDINPIGRRA